MAVEIGLPTLATVLATAVVDSINPCAIGVLILLISILVVNKKKSKMIKVGLAYIGAIFVSYLAIGLGLIAFLSSVPLILTEYISIIVGLLIIFAGIIEIKDYFWYGLGFSLTIPHKFAKKIKGKMKNLSIPAVILLGIFVAGVEFPCTGGPYLAITLLLAQNFNFAAFMLLILYNVIFVAPLLIILFMVLFGVKLQSIQRWKQSNKKYMRLVTGLILITLGWLLILIANGAINLN
jgi:cytochrome c biogenesis protein CcdA